MMVCTELHRSSRKQEIRNNFLRFLDIMWTFRSLIQNLVFLEDKLKQMQFEINCDKIGTKETVHYQNINTMALWLGCTNPTTVYVWPVLRWKGGQQMQYVNDVCVICQIRRAWKEVIEIWYGYIMEKYKVALMAFFEASPETFC